MDRETVTQEQGETVKTTVQFDSELWDRAKIAAVHARTTLQALCALGLERVVTEIEQARQPTVPIAGSLGTRSKK